ncbi:MAG TPA: hypothetical protein VFO08_10485, partial [Methylomirabilota bacterium]|nr:hypothetical protein [Methylomirabilota bacterium]
MKVATGRTPVIAVDSTNADRLKLSNWRALAVLGAARLKSNIDGKVERHPPAVCPSQAEPEVDPTWAHGSSSCSSRPNGFLCERAVGRTAQKVPS